jgi:hypothetical protein
MPRFYPDGIHAPPVNPPAFMENIPQLLEATLVYILHIVYDQYNKMEKVKDTAEMFRQFAAGKFNSHVEEIKKKSAGHTIVQEETNHVLFEKHREILGRELNDEIEKLMNGKNDTALKEQLKNMKQSFLLHLHPDKMPG